MAELEYQRDGAVGTILLNRPQRRNAFTLAMIDDWLAALQAAEADPAVAVVVLRGAGGTFCSGADLDVVLDEMGDTPLAQKEILRGRIQPIPRLAARMDTPLIAVIEGVAAGAGLDLALMCDLRLAGASARMGETYIKAGLIPGAGGCFHLPRLVGAAKAFELLVTGDLIDAGTAERIGLVNHVHPDDRVVAEAYALAERVAAAPPELVAMIKRTLRQSATSDLDTSLELVSSHMGVIRSTDASREAFAGLRATLAGGSAR